MNEKQNVHCDCLVFEHVCSRLLEFSGFLEVTALILAKIMIKNRKFTLTNTFTNLP